MLKPAIFAAFLLCVGAWPTQAQSNAAFSRPGPEGPAINFSLGAEQVMDRYLKAQEGFAQALDAILAVPADQRDFGNTARALDAAWAAYDDQAQPLMFLKQVSPEASIRQAADQVENDYNDFKAKSLSRPDLFQAVSQAAGKATNLADEDRRLLALTLRNFKNAGAGLDPEMRKKFVALQSRLSALQSEFARNINEHQDRLELTLPELKGLPQSEIERLGRTADGKYVVTLSYPDVHAFMSHAENAELRKKLALKFDERAAQKNMPLIGEAVNIRHIIARVLGYESFPHMTLDARMAGNPQRVWDFLNDLWPIVRQKADKEIGELLALKKKDDPSAERVNSWDKAFYLEKLRQARYDYDAEKVREYFPAEKVISGTMKVYERVLGVKFAEVPQADAWHPEVKLYRVDDAATGARLGFFYLDLYPREGKYTHAAVFPLQQGRETAAGYQAPVAAMVVNFTKPAAGKPALLSHDDEVETFFHEFGHVMHMTLSRARYASLSGLNVAWDFAEAPSQMLENFVWRREVLDEISGHYQDDSKKLPEDVLKKMLAARALGSGTLYARQLSLAMGDLALHQAVPVAVNGLFNQFLELVGLFPIQPQSHMLASFGHLMGGYESAYYSYLWSEVFADDIFTRFNKEGIFSSAGLDYRREILEQGSRRPEEESLRKFLGREPSAKAFMDKLAEPSLFASSQEVPPDQVTAAFYQEAVRQGLKKPLTGLSDSRLADPNALLKEGWRSHGIGESIEFYLFSPDDVTVQIYVRRNDTGAAALITYDRSGKTLRAERIARHPDGKIERTYGPA